jgi:hypothetical protein
VRQGYSYNGRGERVARWNIASPSGSVFYVYDAAGRLLGEYQPSGNRE